MKLWMHMDALMGVLTAQMMEMNGLAWRTAGLKYRYVDGKYHKTGYLLDEGEHKE